MAACRTILWIVNNFGSPVKKNMQQQLVTSSLFDVETYSQSDVVDRVVGSSLSSLKDESSQDSDFIPEL